MLAYSLREPKVEFHQIDASGNLAKTFSIALAAPTMIHDFILTEQHIVLLAGPAIFDLQAAQSGKPLLQWRPDLGTRIGLIALDGSSTQWLEADPFFVFHFGNGFERGGQLFLDYVRHDRLNLGYAANSQKPPTLHRMSIDLAGHKITDTEIANIVVEFPRINDSLQRAAHPLRLPADPHRHPSGRQPAFGHFQYHDEGQYGDRRHCSP